MAYSCILKVLDLDLLDQHNLDVSWGLSKGIGRETQHRNTNGGLNMSKYAEHTIGQKHERVTCATHKS